MSSLTRQLKHLFPVFSQTELIGKIIKTGQLMDIPAGTQILASGEIITIIPLVFSGSIKVAREDEDGNEIFLYYIREGERKGAPYGPIDYFQNRNCQRSKQFQGGDLPITTTNETKEDHPNRKTHVDLIRDHMSWPFYKKYFSTVTFVTPSFQSALYICPYETVTQLGSSDPGLSYLSTPFLSDRALN